MTIKRITVYTIMRGERGEGMVSIIHRCFRTRSKLLAFCNRTGVLKQEVGDDKLKVKDFDENGDYWLPNGVDYLSIEEFDLVDRNDK